ncbi:Ribulose-phosphate 3-epimerase [compost metagenome]
MGVNPGFIGQKLLKASLTKSLHLADIIKQKGLNTDIILDGGVKLENLKEIYEHKVDGVVVGTGIFHHNLGTEAALKAFKHTAKELHKEGQYH